METKEGEKADTDNRGDITSKATEGLPTLTAAVVSAYVQHNALSSADVPGLIHEVHSALKSIRTGVAIAIEEKLEPAVPIRKSITPDYLVCLDDGKHFKSLKRHLSSLGLTPDEYRRKWGLPFDYPMVAPSYSAVRSKLAKDAGLGVKAKAAKAKKPRNKVQAN